MRSDNNPKSRMVFFSKTTSQTELKEWDNLRASLEFLGLPLRSRHLLRGRAPNPCQRKSDRATNLLVHRLVAIFCFENYFQNGFHF